MVHWSFIDEITYIFFVCIFQVKHAKAILLQLTFLENFVDYSAANSLLGGDFNKKSCLFFNKHSLECIPERRSSSNNLDAILKTTEPNTDFRSRKFWLQTNFAPIGLLRKTNFSGVIWVIYPRKHLNFQVCVGSIGGRGGWGCCYTCIGGGRWL